MKRLILLLKLATSHGNSPHSDGSPRYILRVLLLFVVNPSLTSGLASQPASVLCRTAITGTYRLETPRDRFPSVVEVPSFH